MKPDAPQMTDGDVMHIHQLMELAAENKWYDLAQKLRDSRELLKSLLRNQWAQRQLDRIEEN